MGRAIDNGLRTWKPITSHKQLAIRLGMEKSTFNKFRKKVLCQLRELLPGDGDLIDQTPLLTERGRQLWEWADWVVRVTSDTQY
jgi:hypothetical protein